MNPVVTIKYVQHQGDRPGQRAGVATGTDSGVLGVVVHPVDQRPRPGGEALEVPSEQAVDALEQDLVDPHYGSAEHVERRPGEVTGALGDDLGDPGPIDQGLDVYPLHQGVDIGCLEQLVDVDPSDQSLDVDAIEKGIDVYPFEQGVHIDMFEDQVRVDDVQYPFTRPAGSALEETSFFPVLGDCLRAHPGEASR